MTLVIAIAMVVCWVLEILHPAIIGFIGAFLFCVVGVDFDTAFHGFGTETPWFLYGALLLFGAAERSGLIAWLGARTPRVLIGSLVPPAIALIALAYLLALVVPSSLARATMLLMLATAWMRGPWLVMAVAYSAAAFGHPDVAGGPTSIVGWDIAVAIALLGVTAWVSRSVAGTEDGARDLTPVQLKIAAPVVLAVVLWLTTAVHGVSPALVGLACGLVCWLPGIAPPDKHSPTADHLAVIFAGTAITIPAVLIETKAVETLTRAWVEVNQSAGVLPSSLVGYWSTVVYRIFSPDGARPELPPLGNVLGSTAIWSYAGSTLFSLHQSPAFIFAMAVGGCRQRHVLTAGLLVLILGSAVVIMF